MIFYIKLSVLTGSGLELGRFIMSGNGLTRPLGTSRTGDTKNQVVTGSALKSGLENGTTSPAKWKDLLYARQKPFQEVNRLQITPPQIEY